MHPGAVLRGSFGPPAELLRQPCSHRSPPEQDLLAALGAQLELPGDPPQGKAEEVSMEVRVEHGGSLAGGGRPVALEVPVPHVLEAHQPQGSGPAASARTYRIVSRCGSKE